MRTSEAATLFQRIEVLPGRRVRHAAVASLFPNRQGFFDGCRIIFAALLVAVGLSGCASMGTGRPAVVRAEDVLNNAPIVYDLLFVLHKVPGVSQLEPTEVYDGIERMRKAWPAADRVLRRTVRLYKLGSASKVDLDTALAQAEDLLDEIRSFLAEVKSIKPPPAPPVPGVSSLLGTTPPMVHTLEWGPTHAAVSTPGFHTMEAPR